MLNDLEIDSIIVPRVLDTYVYFACIIIFIILTLRNYTYYSKNYKQSYIHITFAISSK